MTSDPDFKVTTFFGIDYLRNDTRWSHSYYLSGRTHYVRAPATNSEPSAVLYGVPQGSVLGPIVFLLYTADVLQLVKDHGRLPHSYADNTQIDPRRMSSI